MTNDVFTFNVDRSILTGELTVDGDDMKGFGIAGQGRRVAITLRRVDAGAPASSAPK